MEYELTDKQLDRLMKPYWDTMFENSKLGTLVEYGDDDDDWRGIIKKTPNGKELLIGYPYLDIGDTWYSNGSYFEGGWTMYNIHTGDFNASMRRYVNDRFGTNIEAVI